MTLHHATVKAAEKYGFTLEEKGNHVRAFMPSTGVAIYGVSGKDAFNQMLQMQNIMQRDPDIRWQHDLDTMVTGQLRKGTEFSVLVATPTEHYRNFKDVEWTDGDDDEADAENVQRIRELVVDNIEDTFAEDDAPANGGATALIKRSEKGVPLDGAIAYAEGIMAADNPFEEGSEEGDEWDAQWDQAADESPEHDEEGGGSVVKSKYRTKYKELGHPTHCGDWLAEVLNNFCIGDKHTDLETFEHICSLNGVDTSKYKREGVGWQGRIRMTGRNLLAKKVFSAGALLVPNTEVEGGVQKLNAPEDWLASQRFSKPTEA